MNAATGLLAAKFALGPVLLPQSRRGYCPLQFATQPGASALDAFHPGPSLYPRWAQALAQIIVEGRARWARQP